MPEPKKTPDKPASSPDRPEAGEGSGGVEIRVEDLHKAFAGRAVLAGVNMEVRAGEMVAIVGASGCGKTVLLNHIIGNLTPDKGRVLVADHERPGAPLVDLATLDEDALDLIRLHWAVVFQKNALFSGTVYENIALWLRENQRMTREQILPRARAALRAVGFKDDEEILDKDRDELSGGMAKRVAVARALSMEPMLMFYDEPTTGLDPYHAAMIHELIVVTHELPRPGGRRGTTVIITHDKDLLRRLRPRIVMLHEGTVFFDGPFEQFERNDSEIIRPYFATMEALHLRDREPPAPALGA